MPDNERERVSTGIPGLDDIADGGFTRRRLMLIEACWLGKRPSPQFLLAGALRSEPVLCHLSKPEELVAVAGHAAGRSMALRYGTDPSEAGSSTTERDVPSGGGQLASITNLILAVSIG
jgi:hypothetical protein